MVGIGNEDKIQIYWELNKKKQGKNKPRSPPFESSNSGVGRDHTLTNKSMTICYIFAAVVKAPIYASLRFLLPNILLCCMNMC